MKTRFVIYGLLGLIMETVWTGLGSLLAGDWRLKSFTSLWMFTIYGLAVFLEPLHESIRPWPWFSRGLLWVVVIFGIEFAAGGLLREVTGASPWDYAGKTYNIDGLIRLDYAPAWFAAGLFFERVHDWLKRNLPIK